MHSRETRVGACADYLIGKSGAEIELKWGVKIPTVSRWIKEAGSFKLRRPDVRRAGRTTVNIEGAPHG